MLERSAIKVARSVLRGLEVGNDLRLLDFNGMERARYWGLTKVNVQFIITAIVVNVKRLANVIANAI